MKYLFFIAVAFVSITTEANDKDTLLNRFSINYSKDDNRIVILDNLTNKESKWAAIPDCYKDHYHFAEYHNHNLYVLRRINADMPDWRDELWVYAENDNKGKLLLEKRGLDFRVNNKQTLISYYETDTLAVLDLKSNTTKKVKIGDDEGQDYYIESMRWSNDKDMVWGLLSWSSASHYYFFSYDHANNKLTKFKVPEGCAYDYDINPNSGLLLYSNYPMIVDVESAEELVKAKQKMDLYILDFNSNQKTILRSGIAREFNPKWISDSSIEFNGLSKKREQVAYKK